MIKAFCGEITRSFKREEVSQTFHFLPLFPPYPFRVRSVFFKDITPHGDNLLDEDGFIFSPPFAKTAKADVNSSMETPRAREWRGPF